MYRNSEGYHDPTAGVAINRAVEATALKKYDVVYVKDYDRPAIVLQNNKGNAFAKTTIVAFITSKVKRLDIPTRVELKGYKLWKPSMVRLEMLSTVPKELIVKKIDHLRDEDIVRVEQALDISLDRGRCV